MGIRLESVVSYVYGIARSQPGRHHVIHESFAVYQLLEFGEKVVEVWNFSWTASLIRPS